MRERQSNIELLRLVCMFMIIWVHFTGHVILYHSELYVTQTGWGAYLPQLLHALCFCAVNTFVLISGYFGIRPKVRSFLNLYVIVAFYAFVMYAVHLYLTGTHINRWLVYNTIMPFGLWNSTNDWWFMPNYLILYLLSPILNKAIDAMSKKEMQMSLGLIGIVIFYFGWYRDMVWAQGGFNFVNFSFLYFVGRYMALFTSTKPKSSYKWMIGWIVSAVAISLIDFFQPISSPIVWYNGSYNSPLCVFAAIALFNMFRNINIKENKVINWYAASALAIYLIHDCAYVRNYLYDFFISVYDTQPLAEAYGIMLGISVAMMAILPIVDKLRMLITNPIVRYGTTIYENLKEKMACQR